MDVVVSRALTLILAVVLALGVTAGCKDGGKTAPPPTPNTDSEPKPVKDETMDWDRAEQIARDHHLESGGGPNAELVRIPRVEYLFQAGHWFILVHRGAVLTAQGSGALAGYLAETSPETRRAVTADDLIALVRLLGAFPPVKGRDPLRFHQDAAHPGLMPRLDRDGDRASFHLFYDLTKNAGASEDPDLRTIAEWTLAIEASGASAWTETPRSYHLGRNAFEP